MSRPGYFDQSYPPSIYAPPVPPGPDKGAAAPGDVFPAEPTVTAEDPTNAAKLSGLGFVADPTSVWVAAEFITVGAFQFHWDGAAWTPGDAP